MPCILEETNYYKTNCIIQNLIMTKRESDNHKYYKNKGQIDKKSDNQIMSGIKLSKETLFYNQKWNNKENQH